MSDAVPHVCMLCTQHLADDVRSTEKLAVAMKQAGFRVTWVGSDEVFPKNDYGIDFRFYHSRRHRLLRLRNWRKAQSLAAMVEDVDVFYAVHPDTVNAVVALARKTGAKAILDIHEIYHDEMLNQWASGIVKKIAGWFIHRSIARALNHVDFVTYSGKSVIAPYPNITVQTVRARNCPRREFADEPLADVLSPHRQAVTIMHGKANLGRGIESMLRAIATASRRLSKPMRLVTFPFFVPQENFGEPELRALASEVGAAEALDLRLPVSFRQMPAVLGECDIGAIMFARKQGGRFLPCRIFEYMALGLPIICPSYGDEMRKLIQAENCGIMVDCEDPDAVAEAICHLCENPEKAREMGLRGRKAFLARGNFDVDVEPMLEYVRSWADERRSSASDPRTDEGM